MLLNIFHLIGICKEDSSGGLCNRARHFMKFIYPLFTIITLLDGIIMFAVHTSFDPSDPQTGIAYIVSCAITLAAWHALYKKGQLLNQIFTSLQDVSQRRLKPSKLRSFFLNVILWLNLIAACGFPLFFLIGSSEADHYCRVFLYYTLEGCSPSLAIRLFFFIKALSASIASSLFCTVISIIYCFLCNRCSVLLKDYRRRMQRIAFLNGFRKKLNSDFGKDYHDLIRIIHCIQSVFYCASFLIFLVSFMQAFTVLALLILYNDEHMSLFYIMENFCLHFSSGTFAFLIPFFSAQVFAEMKRNWIAFQKLYSRVIFESGEDVVTSERLDVLNSLKQISPFKLSAWGLIDFSGGTVLAVLGTLLTYGLLVLSASN